MKEHKEIRKARNVVRRNSRWVEVGVAALLVIEAVKAALPYVLPLIGA